MRPISSVRTLSTLHAWRKLGRNEMLPAQGHPSATQQRGASLGRAASRIGRLNAQTAFQSAVLSAQADRLSAGDAAQGQRMGALSSLLTGAGSMLGDSYTANRLGMGNIPSVTVRSSNSSIFR
jgi:hypothetical protein